MQNILVFRFANRFIEPVLRAAHVDEIQITVAETLGVEGRSRYYDGIGALRDMIQNHLIQMMTISTMEPPALWDAEMLRDHKVEVLKAVRPLDPDSDAVRGQYTAGLVDGAARHRLPRRAGRRSDVAHRHVRRAAAAPRHVAVGRRAGPHAFGQAARRPRRTKSRSVSRNRRPGCSATRRSSTPTQLAGVPHEPDRVHRARRAHEAARPRARSARVGAARGVHRRDGRPTRRPRTSGLLLDVLEGDHTPFLRFDEVEWSWRIVDPVLEGVGGGRARGLRRRQRRTRPASTASSAPATPGGRSRRGA